jgi:hypothetical protein
MLELTSSPGPGHGLNIMKGHCRIGLSFQSSIERMVSLWNAMFFFLNKLNSWSMLMLMLMLMSMSCSHILLKKMWCLRTSKKTWFNLSFSSSSSSFLWQIQGEILFFFFFLSKTGFQLSPRLSVCSAVVPFARYVWPKSCWETYFLYIYTYYLIRISM